MAQPQLAQGRIVRNNRSDLIYQNFGMVTEKIAVTDPDVGAGINSNTLNSGLGHGTRFSCPWASTMLLHISADQPITPVLYRFNPRANGGAGAFDLGVNLVAVPSANADTTPAVQEVIMLPCDEYKIEYINNGAAPLTRARIYVTAFRR